MKTIVSCSLVLMALIAVCPTAGAQNGGAARRASAYAKTQTPASSLGGRRAVPYPYPTTNVNVNLPDPAAVGKERRSTMGQRSTSFGERQNTSQLGRQTMQSNRMGAMSSKNAYHGLSTQSYGRGMGYESAAGKGKFCAVGDHKLLKK